MSDDDEDSLERWSRRRDEEGEASQDEEEYEEYLIQDMENGKIENIDPSNHYLDDILRDDFYLTYKHEKLPDIPSDYFDRFNKLRSAILDIGVRKELQFKKLKGLIAQFFPRGKKDTKTKERVDEIIARVYTEATRRMMRLMLEEGDTSILKIDPERFISINKDLESLRQAKPEEFKNIQMFYRAIYVAHRIIGIPCQGFRNHFMRIGTLLENSGIYYATGGRPAKTTMARKELIDKLTRCQRTKRISKKVLPSSTNTVDSHQGGLALLLKAAEQNDLDEMVNICSKEPFQPEYQSMDAMNRINDEWRVLRKDGTPSVPRIKEEEVVDYTTLLAIPAR